MPTSFASIITSVQRKKKIILPECQSIKWCTLIIDVPCLFPFMAIIFAITLCSSICLFHFVFIPHPFFHAGDEVVWQNVPQQQKE